MQKLLLYIILSLSYYPAVCCINGYEKIPGVMTEEYNTWELGYPHVYEEDINSFILSKVKSGNWDLKKEDIDIAIGYLYLKKFKEALKITTQLYKKFPNEYNIVITHAATKELNGLFEEALILIKKALLINPSSHYNSEWIHEKIIEAYISKKDVLKYSVIDVNFGNEIIPKGTRNRKELTALQKQLSFQISERIYFTPITDVVMGSLLFDFANTLFANNYITASLSYYEKAKVYGYTSDILDKRIAYLKDREAKGISSKEENDESKEKKDEKLDANNVYFYLSIGAILIVGGLFFVFLRRKK